MKNTLTGKRSLFGYEQKKRWAGFLFILPWLVGFLTLFLRPILSSVRYSVTDATITEGMKGDFIGLSLYVKAFSSDQKFVQYLTAELGNFAYHVPVILCFSLFLAVILNQKFHGRTVMRAIFFIPVICGSGVILQIMSGDAMSQSVISGARSSMLYQSSALEQILLNTGLSDDLVKTLTGIVSDIFNLTWKSGLQILLFISGLNAIPPHLYEAAHVEGATSWESFWKITLPMVSPIVIVNLIYTVIDGFTDYQNSVMTYILDFGKRLEFSYSAALSWIYFVLVGVIVGIVYAVINRRVTYVED